MATRVLVLPSPLLPPIAYVRLIDALHAKDTDAAVADPTLDSVARVGHLVARWAEQAATSDLLLAHSNAGFVAPVVRARTGAQVPIVFMDAALPPEDGESPLAPPSVRDTIASLADEHGVLPPWTRWWPRSTLASVVPDDLFTAIDDACPRLPASYFDQRVDVPDDWTTGANAYLAFGETYRSELDFARDHGWPVDVVDGGHLHFLHEPDDVAERLLGLAGAGSASSNDG